MKNETTSKNIWVGLIFPQTIDGIGNLMDLPRLMFLDEECGNLKVVVDGG